MSYKKKAYYRRTYDQYFTDPRLLHVLSKDVTIMGDVIEPCNGKGHLSNALHTLKRVDHVITNDIDPALDAYNDTTQDAANKNAAIWKRVYEWCVTNPPFNDAAGILAAAWERSNRVALLTRWTFLEPTKKRAPLLIRLRPYLSNIIIFGQPRPSFTENGRTDSVTTAWLVWQRDHVGKGVDLRFAPNWKEVDKHPLFRTL